MLITTAILSLNCLMIHKVDCPTSIVAKEWVNIMWSSFYVNFELWTAVSASFRLWT